MGERETGRDSGQVVFPSTDRSGDEISPRPSWPLLPRSNPCTSGTGETHGTDKTSYPFCRNSENILLILPTDYYEQTQDSHDSEPPVASSIPSRNLLQTDEWDKLFGRLNSFANIVVLSGHRHPGV
jgi:hypothetical protein